MRASRTPSLWRASLPGVDDDPTTEELKVQQGEREEAERAAAEAARDSGAVGADEAEEKHERRAEKSAYLSEKLEERADAEREAAADED